MATYQKLKGEYLHMENRLFELTFDITPKTDQLGWDGSSRPGVPVELDFTLRT